MASLTFWLAQRFGRDNMQTKVTKKKTLHCQDGTGMIHTECVLEHNERLPLSRAFTAMNIHDMRWDDGVARREYHKVHSTHKMPILDQMLAKSIERYIRRSILYSVPAMSMRCRCTVSAGF